MPEMTKEQMIEMIQDMELIEWNKAKKMEKIMGCNASVTYEMKHRCEAIRDLMREMAIEEKDEIKRITSKY